MSTQHDTSATEARRLGLSIIRAALKRIRYRRGRRIPSTTRVDQATQTSTSPSTAMSTTVLDQATQTPTWPSDGQLDSQDEGCKQTGFQFLGLPLELRRKVYRHYINDLSPLTYSSPQICHEVADVTDRIFTFQMFNGLCPPHRRKLELAEEAAVQFLTFYDKFQGKNLRLRIELQCSYTSLMVECPLTALMDVVGARELAPVEVYMTEGEVCSFCASYPQSNPLKTIRRLVERVERLRDGGLVRYGVQPRCDCRGRRLE